jgi:hypothetical protein
LVQKLRDHAGTTAAQKTQAAAWLRSTLEWEHRLAELRGHPMSCAHELPPARQRGVA